MDHDLATLSAKPDTEFTVPQVKHYTYQLISGLKHCHDNQVLHHDIKGSDLLLDKNDILKIADFGSASFVDLIHEQPMTNRIVTFWYRAPELLLGATEYGVGVNLWSAGCILAGLLANKPILAGHTEADQLQKIYALCGSPSDEYWKTYKLPLETLYKPQQQFERCIADTFKDFPPSSLPLLDILLSFDPVKRESAASALESKTERRVLDFSTLKSCKRIGRNCKTCNRFKFIEPVFISVEGLQMMDLITCSIHATYKKIRLYMCSFPKLSSIYICYNISYILPLYHLWIISTLINLFLL